MRRLAEAAVFSVLASLASTPALSQHRCLGPTDVMDAWLHAHGQGDADALALLYEEEGRHSTVTTHAGRDAIRALFARNLSHTRDFALEQRRTVLQEHHAVETGKALQTVTLQEEAPIRLEADYAVLLAMGPDGCWRIRHLAGGPPAAGAQ